MLEKYKCHKTVWAQKISDIEMNPDGSNEAFLWPGQIRVGSKYMEKHMPQVGGYYVKYEDGYESFSPAEAFEKGYSKSIWDHVETISNPMFTKKYTLVRGGNVSKENTTALHDFIVLANDEDQIIDFETSKILGEIHFQQGPIKECGVNGVMNEDLLLMVITRLKAFQNTEFACRENAIAITKLEEAVLWLRSRTTERESRFVEGTHAV